MTSSAVYHVDVFATAPLIGNGLAVFLNADGWSVSLMQRLAQEMKHFESIFLSDVATRGARARVFTVEEELPFAGHPVLGAAAVLHEVFGAGQEVMTWLLRLAGGDVSVVTKRFDRQHVAEMNQGIATFGGHLVRHELTAILERLGLESTDLFSDLEAQVVSTGLPYLIVPVSADALARASIRGTDFESLLTRFGAKFVLVLDPEARELRTWDNLGRVEDVATGSAAGPAAAFLINHGLADADLPMQIAQGRFAGRPSTLGVRRNAAGDLFVSGEVWPVLQGNLDASVIQLGH